MLNRCQRASFERHVRDLTKTYRKVTVVSRPLYLPSGEPGERYVHVKVIGDNDVWCPTHFFKVLKLEQASGYIDHQAYIMPNDYIDPETPFKSFKTTIEKIERVSGIIFAFQNAY